MQWFKVDSLQVEGVVLPSLVLLVAVPPLDYLFEPLSTGACVRLFLASFALVVRFKSG